MASAFKKVARQKREQEKHIQGDESEDEHRHINRNKDEVFEVSDNDSVLDLDLIPDSKKDANKDEGLSVFKDADPNSKDWKNRQRTMIFSSRGVTSTHVMLIKDIHNLIANTKIENKMPPKNQKAILDDICFERSCNNFMYFEAHKHQDLYMWLAKSPAGPSIKFEIKDIHTCSELKLQGNCLKYSRPFLSFDKSFDNVTHLKLMKEMFVQVFNTPKNHPKSKPFIDHVISFNYLPDEGAVFFRVYQVVNEFETLFTEKCDVEKLVLIEIGPRMKFQPIKMLDGSLSGQSLWQNEKYITANKTRSKAMGQYLKKREEKLEKKADKKLMHKIGQDEDEYLESAFL